MFKVKYSFIGCVEKKEDKVYDFNRIKQSLEGIFTAIGGRFWNIFSCKKRQKGSTRKDYCWVKKTLHGSVHVELQILSLKKKIARVFEICVIKELRTVDGNWLIKAFGHLRVWEHLIYQTSCHVSVKFEQDRYFG